jgi:hypothetical protein
MFYSLVNSQGDIVRSMFTLDINFPTPDGFRLLPDNPPNPPAYQPGYTKAIRVTPVPLDATEIPYIIVIETATLKTNEISI